MSRAEDVKNWRKRSKQRIIDAFGGKCGTCDYNKCNNALELHHLDPSEKEFSFGSIRANPKNWQDLVIELRKCVLLCSNCHREVHDNLRIIPDSISRFNESFVDYKRIELIDKSKSMINNCPICNKEKPFWNKTCSTFCALSLKGKYDWSKFDLKDLYLIQKKSTIQIAKIVGCSPSGVMKRLIAEGIETRKIQKIINWPDKEILEKMVQEKSLEKIKDELGCSHTGLRKHLKSLGIKWFYPGFWQKRYKILKDK